MKNVLRYAIRAAVLLLLVSLIGCVGRVNQQVTFEKVEYVKAPVTRIELMILHTDIGVFLVRRPEEKLKKFLSDVRSGTRLKIHAGEEVVGEELIGGIYVIQEIVLADGQKYER